MKAVFSRSGIVRVLILLLLAATAVGATGCFAPWIPPTPPTPHATFTITSWTQDYYEYWDEYGLVRVNYRVTNTGSVDIDYYKVWIEVTCADGSKYQEWTNGSNVLRGSYTTDYTFIDTADKRATSVKVTNYQLNPYSY